MVDSIINFLGHYVESYGYYIAVSFAFLENSLFLGLFLPGGIVAILLGFYSAQGKIEPLLLILYLFLGTLGGNNLGYFLGHRYGRKIIKKVGKVFSFEEDHFILAENYYKKHGPHTLIWGRFIAMIGPFIPFTAGVSKMRYLKFFIFDFAGAILWSFWLVAIGYFFGSNWERIAGYLGDIGVLMLVLFVIFIYRYIRRHSESK